MPNSETKWVKFGDINNIAFLGKDVIAVASGIHVLFINLNTKDEKVEKFDSKERGEGASCLAGHPVVPMFAIAERRVNPKISIFTYPEINKISSCIYDKPGRRIGYISSIFGRTEFLITLTSIPDFELIVWQWRTGENLKVISTEISDEFQRISCSSLSPFLVAQLGEVTGKLMVYDLSVCSKIILLTPTASSSSCERITSCSWTYDGNLLLCDDRANISLMYSDGKRRYIVVESILSTTPCWKPCIVDFRGGVAVINAKSKLTFYRRTTTERVKSAGLWKFIWELNIISHPIYMIRHPQRDSLLINTISGEIIEVSVGDDDVPRMQIVSQQGSEYLFLILINPNGQNIAVIDRLNRLIIFECHNGNLVGQISLNNFGKILNIVSHPTLPLVVTSTENGKCNILNVYNPAVPLIVKSFYLIRQPLDKIKFSWDGDVLIVANGNSGRMFVIGEYKNIIDVITSLTVAEKIVDFLTLESNDVYLTLMVLVKAHSYIDIGRIIMIYNIKKCENVSEIRCIVELPNLFKSLHYGENTNIILGNPYLSKQLLLFKVSINSDNCYVIALQDAVTLPHRLRDVNINSHSRFIITYGYDGLIIVRNKMNIQQQITKFTSCHRQEGGIELAVVSSFNNTIISIGKNGNLIATKISQFGSSTSPSDLMDDNNSVDTMRALVSLVQSKLDDSTWDEVKEREKFMREHEATAFERATIKANFEILKKALSELLDKNENESDAQLPIANFDLDIAGRKEKIDINTLEREKLRQKLEDDIICQDKVTEYLRQMCWESMAIPACALISLDGEIRVENYALPNISRDKKNSLDWKKFSVVAATRMINIDESNTLKLKNSNALQFNENEEEEYSMSGTTTHRWLSEIPKNMFNQITRNGSYTEGGYYSILSKLREEKLKHHFNYLFESMRNTKEQEIKLAKEQIARIKHCLAELKETFQVDSFVNYSHLYLDWQDSEMPQMIVKVEDAEVYELISDSTGAQNVNSLENELTEKIERINFFHDSFRHETLLNLMDGVLEVRWEDEIKKDIIKPECLSKSPSAYTNDDLNAINEYEKSVEALNIERLKYKTILENEITQVQEELRDNISKFNTKMKLFFLERIKLESAVLQETLMRLRESQRHQLRLQFSSEVSRLEMLELNPAIIELQRQTEELQLFESIVNDTKNRYENLCKREKLLEGKFRGEFSDLKQPMVEHLLRHYKKRPRIGQLVCTSITYLTEISKCIVSGEKSDILPRDCLDFLKGINSLDIMPSSLPSQIDSNHWYLLCKLRRAKVEIETRLKSCAVELAEAEQTTLAHQKTIQNTQNKIQQLRETIMDVKRRNIEALKNFEIQLVLKMGQIEQKHLCGNPQEFKNTVLVPFDEVLRVNEAIVEAGRKKLEAMRQTLVFRRTTEWREWRHSCLKMTLEDMREEFKVLQSVRVTKEIQIYLMRHLHGAEKDTEIIWTRTVESTKKRYSRMLKNEKTQLIDITQRVDEWQKQNSQLLLTIEKMKSMNLELSELENDVEHVRNVRFQAAKLKAIMKRNRLITKVQDNYEDLINFRRQLEILRLKTYPTLKLKDCDRKKSNEN